MTARLAHLGLWLFFLMVVEMAIFTSHIVRVIHRAKDEILAKIAERQ